MKELNKHPYSEPTKNDQEVENMTNTYENHEDEFQKFQTNLPQSYAPEDQFAMNNMEAKCPLTTIRTATRGLMLAIDELIDEYERGISEEEAVERGVEPGILTVKNDTFTMSKRRSISLDYLAQILPDYHATIHVEVSRARNGLLKNEEGEYADAVESNTPFAQLYSEDLTESSGKKLEEEVKKQLEQSKSLRTEYQTKMNEIKKIILRINSDNGKTSPTIYRKRNEKIKIEAERVKELLVDINKLSENENFETYIMMSKTSIEKTYRLLDNLARTFELDALDGPKDEQSERFALYARKARTAMRDTYVANKGPILGRLAWFFGKTPKGIFEGYFDDAETAAKILTRQREQNAPIGENDGDLDAWQAIPEKNQYSGGPVGTALRNIRDVFVRKETLDEKIGANKMRENSDATREQEALENPLEQLVEDIPLPVLEGTEEDDAVASLYNEPFIDEAPESGTGYKPNVETINTRAKKNRPGKVRGWLNQLRYRRRLPPEHDSFE